MQHTALPALDVSSSNTYTRFEMAHFGAGPELAAQCPRVSPPNGWRAWTDADGPIPEGLAQRIQAMVDDQSLPLETTENYPIPGVTVLIRIEPRVWGRDAQGNLVHGCFRSGGVYLPTGVFFAETVSPPSSSSGWDKAVNVLTVGSLAIGIIATLAAWGKS